MIFKSKITKLYVCAACALIVSIILSMCKFELGCEQLRANCLRMHILANSDSPQDQQLKLKVRDEVLKQTGNIFENADSIDSAKKSAQNNIQKIQNIAQSVCDKNGAGYNVTATVKKEYFPTRSYKNFTLPAGEYEAVRILIGEHKGHNWWCCMYPSVCVGSCKSPSEKTVGKEGKKISSNGKKYKVKFKMIELLQKVKRKKTSK